MKLPAPWVFCCLLACLSNTLVGQEPFGAVLTAVNSNTVRIAWPAEINGAYNLLTTTGADEPWHPLYEDPLFAPINRLTVDQPVDSPSRLFRVSRLDTVPPVAWAVAPAPGAVGVSRRGHISISIYDDGTLDTNSISVVLTNGPPMTLANAPLRLENGILTFDPGTNVLGTFGQVMTVEVRSRDLAGNAFTNIWSFKLEDPALPDPDVIAVSNAPPGLVLIAQADGAFTYTFSGETSGLVPGNILVSEDPTFPYRRLVLDVHEEPMEHEVTALTTNAALAESLDGGGVQVGGELDSTPFIFTSFSPFLPFGAAALPDCCSLTLTNRSLATGPEVEARVTGVVALQPALEARAAFQVSGLAAMDFDFQSKVVAALDLDATAHTAGSFTNRLPLGSATKIFPTEYAGPVPISSSVTISFELVLESSWEKPGRMQMGMVETNLVSLQAQLREPGWTTHGTRLRRFSLPPANCQNGPAAQVRLFMEERVTMALDATPAITVVVRPGLEALSLASAPPGMTGCDLTLFTSLTASLAIQPTVWDAAAVSLSPTNVVAVRDPARHLSDFSWVAATLPVQPLPGMEWIPPGSFWMGDSPTNPPTQVTLTRGFHIGSREVTQAEYATLLNTNVSFFHGGVWGTNLARPLDSVTWVEATNYCARLTLAERQANHIPSSYAYRLPTEAEWEYAARAGTTNPFPTGERLLPGWANFDCVTDPATLCPTNPIFGVLPSELPRQNQPLATGLFAPNGWGLHDMAGNIREWCLDWLGNSLPPGNITDPQGTNATLRALRGGSFNSPSSACRSSARQSAGAGAHSTDGGFRVVLAPVQIPLGPETYTLTLRTGLNFVANQLNHVPNNTIPLLFTNRVFMSVGKYIPEQSNYETSTFDPDAGDWTNPSMTLNPGEAAFVDNHSGAPISVTFTGERVTNFQRTPKVGMQMMSCPVPEPGTPLTILYFPPVDGMSIQRLRPDASGYDTYTYIIDTWDPVEPVTNIGEGVWVDIPFIP